MKKNVENALNNFVDSNEEYNDTKTFLKGRSGLVERIDKTIITEDGRQLLREHY